MSIEPLGWPLIVPSRARPAPAPAAPPPGLLAEDDFRRAVEMLPLVSIDLLLRDADGRYLTGLRSNPPAQGSWFVPGGRIRKKGFKEQKKKRKK